MMARKWYKISASFLLVIFLFPIFTIGIHNSFFHTDSDNHNLAKQGNSIKSTNFSICLIHDFKYFSFENQESLRVYKPKTIWSSDFHPLEISFIKENLTSFYLLRAPPNIIELVA